MSDLQDLIHRNAQLAYEQGVKNERERILKVIQELMVINADHKFFVIESIKGEQK